MFKILDKRQFIYNYNPFKKIRHNGSQFFKTYEDLKLAILKNQNLSEQEVMLYPFKKSDINHEVNIDNIPKFYWDAFSSEIYCFEYKVINKNPVIFASNNISNSFKIFNILGLELCRSNLELPLPLAWDLPVTVIDTLKDKYIEAKRVQMQIRASRPMPKWYFFRNNT